MRLYFAFTLFIAYSFTLQSQNPITDSLVKIASRVEKDSASKLYAKIANIFTGVNSDSVRKYARIADGLAPENSTVKGDVLIQFGNSYHMENKIDSAILYFQKALVYFQKIKNEKGVGKVYQSFSIIKKTQGDLEGAIEDSKKALEIYTKLNWTVGMVNTYNNIASTYSRLQKHAEAVKYGRLAFSTSKLLNDSLKYFSMMSEYGSKLIYVQKVDSAVYYLNSSSKYLERNYMYNLLVPAYCNLAAALDLNKKPNVKIAKDALIRAKYYSVLSGAQDNLRYIYFELGTLFLKEEQPDSALAYFNKTVRIQDSLNMVEGSKLAKEIETKFETEKKELQIQKQAVELEATEKENKAKNRLLLISAIALLCIAVFAFFAWSNFVKVKKANHIIQEQKAEVETKNKEITDSINYAKRLQEAILPSTEFVNLHLPENFIFYKPKDIVAGDFYWAEAVSSKGNFYIAAADSTGHGVPGSLVSVVCSNALNRSLKEFNNTEPGKILDKARELVVETFARKEGATEKTGQNVLDGMDISLLCINRKNKTLSWSGANNSLLYISPGQPYIELKADKQPVGKTENPKPFTTHSIEYKEGATYYLFTDGFPDQFGGPNRKKYKYKNFYELLQANAHLSLNEQAKLIAENFANWKQGLEQTDDVCVIGLRV